MKAKTKAKPFKKPRRTLPTEPEPPSPELLEEQRSFDRFAEQMKPYLEAMEENQRNALLRELKMLIDFKKETEEYAESERRDALRFREYGQWLAGVEKKLRKAKDEFSAAALSYPKRDEQDEIESHTRGEDPRTAVFRVTQELGKAIEVAKDQQQALIAMTSPKLRPKGEAGLVPRELREFIDLPHRVKTNKIDLWFIREAAFIMDDYHTNKGKPIPCHEQIIKHIFSVAFGVIRTETSIRRNLSPSRRNTPRQIF